MGVLVATGCAAEGAPEPPCVRAADYFPFDSGRSWLYARVGVSAADGLPTHLRSTVDAYEAKRHVFTPRTDHGFFAYSVSSSWTCGGGAACVDEVAHTSVWGVGKSGVSILAWHEPPEFAQVDFPVATTCLFDGTVVSGAVDWSTFEGPAAIAQDRSDMTLSIQRADCPSSDDCFELGLDWEPPRELSDPGDVPDRLWVARDVGIVAFEDALGRWELVDE